MKTQFKQDVGELFKKRTENYSQEPPSYIWDKIEAKIFPKFGFNLLKGGILSNWRPISIILGTSILIGSLTIYTVNKQQPIDNSTKLSENSTSEVSVNDIQNNNIQVSNVAIDNNVLENKEIEKQDMNKSVTQNLNSGQRYEASVINKTPIATPELSDKSVEKQVKNNLENKDQTLAESLEKETSSDDNNIDNAIKNTKETDESNNLLDYLIYTQCDFIMFGSVKKITFVDKSGSEIFIIKSPKTKDKKDDCLDLKLPIPEGKYKVTVYTEDNRQFTDDANLD